VFYSEPTLRWSGIWFRWPQRTNSSRRALVLNRGEAVALTPVLDEDGLPRGLANQTAIAVERVRLVDEHLDGGHVARAVEIGLRFLERHVDNGRLVSRHADLEDCGDLVGLDPGGRAHGRDHAARRHQGNAVSDAQRERLGEPAADRYAPGLVEALKRALLDAVRDRTELDEIGPADAAHQDARIER